MNDTVEHGPQHFIAGQITGWVGTLMRHLDAQGTPVEIEDVVLALKMVIDSINPTPGNDEFNDFLASLNEGGDE